MQRSGVLGLCGLDELEGDLCGDLAAGELLDLGGEERRSLWVCERTEDGVGGAALRDAALFERALGAREGLGGVELAELPEARAAEVSVGGLQADL